MNIKNAKHCMCIFYRINYFSLPVYQSKIFFFAFKKTQTDANHRTISQEEPTYPH